MKPADESSGLFDIPAGETRVRQTVANSRFFATIAPVASSEEARAFISRVRSEFPDASHNVPTYIIGGGKSVIEFCSDDGEPSGTAGRPALAVLRGSGLGNVGLVITRYFGGTLLGKGGLVKAYTESAQMAVKAVARARKVLVHNVVLEIPYGILEKVRLKVASCTGHINKEEFTDSVRMELIIPVDDFPAFLVAIKELSAGKAEPKILTTTELLVPKSTQ